METSFRMSVERPREGVIVLSVSGPLDMVTIPRFAELLNTRLQSTAHVVVLDLTGVSFLSSDAIATLAKADLRARGLSKRFSLVTGVRAVDRPLEALGLSNRFTYGSRPVFEVGSPRDEDLVPDIPVPRFREQQPRATDACHA